MSTVIKEHRQESLTCKLTRDEVWDRSKAAAELAKAHAEAENGKKAAAAYWKTTLDEMDEKLSTLLREVRTEETWRPVKVCDEYDFSTGEVRTLRLDTHEVISRRPMKDAERQELLPLADEPALKAVR